MNEHDWLTTTSAEEMLRGLPVRASDRKLRLFGVACCWRLWELLHDPRSRQALVVAEDFAEGWTGIAELRAAHGDAVLAARAAPGPDRQDAARAAALAVYEYEKMWEVIDLLVSLARQAKAGDEAREAAEQAGLLREIFGNPFRPVRLPPHVLDWQEQLLVWKATAVLDTQAFDEIPVLGDIAEEAGCHDQVFLDHLRGPGPHLRGCWALDLLLGND